MSKLPKKHKFIDLSDYGRPFARIISNSLKKTSATPVKITVAFVISGFIAIAFIIMHNFWAAAFFLVLKSILDAADGELSRIKNTPSYTGRYLDSVSDIILNLLFLTSIAYITNTNFIYALIAFFCIQLQGTLYNYYYVILRTRLSGDTTSRIFETKTPTALDGELQKNVNILFKLYKALYGIFDKTIYFLDPKAVSGKKLPNWFMTLVSIFGLGFQLLIISVMLVLGWAHYIIPFFMALSIFIFVFITIRKLL